jgi:2-methylfumaryl-CoA isomerase
LSALRADLITVRIMGQADGGPALDYTVNCAVGLPYMTGPATLGAVPVNHVLPAWDLVTGSYAAFALLAAERRRRASGEGADVRIPLSDVAITTLAHLGQVAEVSTMRGDRPRLGNELYGAFGRDFVTRDGQRLMIIALTQRHWTGLTKVLGIAQEVAAIEQRLGVSFAQDEGIRFQYRDELTPLVEKAVVARDYAELRTAFDANGVCWGPYRTLFETVSAPDGWVQGNPVFTGIDNPSGCRYPVPGSAASLPGQRRNVPIRAPRLGEHTDEVLAEVLGLSAAAIGTLHDAGIVAGFDSAG